MPHSFENRCFSELWRCPKCWHISLHHISKLHVTIITDLIKSVLTTADLSPWWIKVLQKSELHLKAHILSLVTYIISHFPLSNRLLWFTHEKLPNSQVWVTTVFCFFFFSLPLSLILSSQNNLQGKKWLVQRAAQPIAPMLFFKPTTVPR